jgi:hypothetical protein
MTTPGTYLHDKATHACTPSVFRMIRAYKKQQPDDPTSSTFWRVRMNDLPEYLSHNPAMPRKLD